MSEAIAVIPARGGSTRFPRKNVVALDGRPLIAYSIVAALQSGLFDRIVVSTEDAEIAEKAAAAGAEVFERAPRLAADMVKVVDVCRDVLEKVAHTEGATPDAFCCLLATAALRTADDIVQAYRLLEPGRCDFVMAVTEYSKSPLQALEVLPDGSLRLMWPELAETPRWEQPKFVVDNGSTYWCRTEAFLAANTFYGPNLRGYVMPRERSVDVDTPEDLELLRYYAARAHGSN